MRRVKFLFKLRDARGVFGRCAHGRRWYRWPGLLDKTHEEHIARRSLLNADFHPGCFRVALNTSAGLPARVSAFPRAFEGFAKLRTKPLPGHQKDIAVRFAWSNLQKLVDRARIKQSVIFPIDQNRRWRESLKQ